VIGVQAAYRHEGETSHYYKTESGCAGETDLIVTKHRNGPTATVTATHQFHYSRLRDMSPAQEPVTSRETT
jgi:replicative DNA helicase